LPHLQIELPSILRDLPACLTYLLVLSSRLIQHGIRVIDVQIDFTWALESSQPCQAALTRRYRHMPHLARRLAAALNANQLIIAPKRPVEEHDISRVQLAKQ